MLLRSAPGHKIRRKLSRESPEQRHSMRSLYVGILLAMAGTLSLSLVVFLAISRQIERTTFYRTFERTDELQLEEARKALDRGGPAAVSALYAACEPGLWWLALSPQFRGCRCRFRPGSIEPDPWGWSGRKGGNAAQASWSLAAERRMARTGLSPSHPLGLIPGTSFRTTCWS